MIGRRLERAMFFWLFAVVVFSFGCQKNSASSLSGELRVPLGTDPGVLDPQLADTGVQVFVLRQVLSTLLDYDDQLRLVPKDAERWEWSKDGRTLEVWIRSGLTWSDGVPVHACMYRDALARALKPETASRLSDLLWDIRGAKEVKLGKISVSELGVQCPEANRLVIQANTVRPQRLLHALAFIISAPVRLDEIQERQESWLLPKDTRPGLSLGLFSITRWERDRKLVLEKRGVLPNSNDKALRRLVLHLVRDPNTAWSLYQSGELDVLDEIPSVLLAKAHERKDLVMAPTFVTYMVGFSLKANPVLKDKRVRRALALSANQSEIPKLLGGAEVEAKAWTPESLLPSSARPKEPIFNPEAAKKLLAEAGFANGKNFPKLELYFNSGDKHQIIMERLANNWKTILGVSVELNPLDWKVLVSRIQSRAPDLYRYAWTAVYPDPLFFLELYHSQSSNNFGSWSNKEFDSIVESLRQVAVEKRDEAFWRQFRKAENILVREDPALIPVYHYSKRMLVSPRVQGLRFDSRGIMKFENVQFR